MKKFCVGLLCIYLLFAAAACGKDGQTATDTGRVYLNTFETQADLSTMRMFGTLGKVQLNKESAYVREGQASAKIIVSAEPYKENSTPYLQQAFNIQGKQGYYGDLSKFDKLSFEIYNASTEEKTVGLQLVYTDDGIIDAMLSNPKETGFFQEFALSPESWTTVIYPIRREYVYMARNGDMSAQFLEIQFGRGESDDVYYMDSMCMHEAKQPVQNLSASLRDGEICSFDYLWQTEALEFEDSGLSMIRPSARYVSDFGISGACVRIDSPVGLADGKVVDRWPGVVLTEGMLAGVPWEVYPKTARLCFNIYIPEENGVSRVDLNVYAGDTLYFVSEKNLEPGRWTEFSFTVEQMTENAADGNIFAQTTRLVLRWAESGESDRVFYADNFRMEI